ncbi:hypothetical protein [Oribacterium sp. NK2B42]|uniref:hypothetical protein n=1 Tax=Oribacterium sp. NK2B42 TaxID=689781 RepID=UPI000416FC30|nr:hypothetical protein [Oribacterium sp. NK2B42]
MTKEQKNKCHKIIHTSSAAAASVGLGLANIPGSDCVPLNGIQIAMVIGLGKVFGKTLTEATATSAVATTMAGSAGKYIANLLTGWIPGVGNAVNGTIAFSITEFLGWTIAKEFDVGGIL